MDGQAMEDHERRMRAMVRSQEGERVLGDDASRQARAGPPGAGWGSSHTHRVHGANPGVW